VAATVPVLTIQCRKIQTGRAWVRRSVRGLSPPACSFHFRAAHVKLVVNKAALVPVSLLVFQFPLSVSFHQCSILIHPSTTDAVKGFSPSTSVSPVSVIPPMLHTHSSIYHRRCIMFFSQYFSFPVSIIPPVLHTHSFIYHRRCIMFFSPYFSFPVSIIPPVLHTHSLIYHRCYVILATGSVIN
jgi:hypothetical protein